MNNLRIIADSGSTKTDWVIVDEDGNYLQQCRTIGFNPYFQTSAFIYDTLSTAFRPFADLIPLITEVNYYGAGCSSPDKVVVVKDALIKLFKNADIFVEHDMMAASRATLGMEPGIACILGTGANSCIWDGAEIIDNIPSHGFIFGDEGSGSYLGIELLKLYLSNQLPNELRLGFENEFNADENEILSKTYQGDSPNVFLASFASFYSKFKNHPTLNKIVEDGFELFFDKRVVKYSNYENYKLGFVGSIAYYFQDTLKKVAQRHNMQIASITKCPIDNLVEFHCTKKVA